MILYGEVKNVFDWRRGKMIQEMNYLSIIYILVLLIPIFAINKYLGLQLNQRIAVGTVRMIVQLSLVGIFLQYVFELNYTIINILYVAVMVFVASMSTIKTCNLPRFKLIMPIFSAFVIPTFAILIYFTFIVLKIDQVFHAQYLIPIGGMILGNSLSGNIIAVNSFYKDIRENENKYFYSLSLSASRKEAVKPYFKNAVIQSANPIIASIETIGLVALPGMMTGQILSGTIPLTAIKYQIAIMIAILVSRYFSGILAIVFTSYKMFDDYDRLIKE